MKGSTRVYDIRPTQEVRKAFPDISRETYTCSKEANARGYEIKRKFEAWKAGEETEMRINPHSVASLVDYYYGSMAFTEIKAASTKRSYRGHLTTYCPYR
jgi:hypothetical protein